MSRVNSMDLALRARAEAVIPGGMYGHQSVALMPEGYPQFFARAEGAHLWDVDGNRYLDMLSGLAVNALGHAHPQVIGAISAQLSTLGHVSNFFATPTQIALAEKLNAMTPGSHAKKTALFSTGAEAIENAIKIARSYTKRSRAYHDLVPAHRYGTPKEIAGAVEYLASDVTGYFIGHVLPVDGGFMAGGMPSLRLHIAAPEELHH